QALERLKAVEAADAIAEGLEEFGTRGEAIKLLKGFGPAAEKTVIKCLESKNQQVREAACAILKEIGTKDCVPGLREALAHQGTRRTALETLERLKAVEAATDIAKCLEIFGGDREAIRILKGFGPAAEKAVIPYLRSKEGFARRTACEILGEIGTRECIPALNAAVMQDNGLQGIATEAYKKILARTK